MPQSYPAIPCHRPTVVYARLYACRSADNSIIGHIPYSTGKQIHLDHLHTQQIQSHIFLSLHNAEAGETELKQRSSNRDR